MFVRISRGSHDALYECSHVRSTFDADKQEILLTMEDVPGRTGVLQVLVSKDVPEELGVYFMNSSGRTIDTVFRKEAGPLSSGHKDRMEPMSEKPENPPDQLHVVEHGETEHGVAVEIHMPVMELRDWFASQALVVIKSAHMYSPEYMATLAYQIADSMLAARQKIHD